MWTKRADGKATAAASATNAVSGVCSTARSPPTRPRRRATASVRRILAAATSAGRTTSSGIDALCGATSPRSTKPGSEPIERPRNVVPERGEPTTKTSRSSSGPNRSRSEGPPRRASRRAVRRCRTALERVPGTPLWSQSARPQAVARSCPSRTVCSGSAPFSSRRSSAWTQRGQNWASTPSRSSWIAS